MTITFHSEAKREFFEAAEYHEEQVLGSGDNFINEVEKVLDIIGLHPESGIHVSKTECRFLVLRLPYGIIYSVEANQIIIFTVMDLRRNASTSLDDLRSPPGNRLEALRGDYKGYHSIRINAQWRIVFRWQDSSAYDVAIIDYH